MHIPIQLSPIFPLYMRGICWKLVGKQPNYNIATLRNFLATKKLEIFRRRDVVMLINAFFFAFARKKLCKKEKNETFIFLRQVKNSMSLCLIIRYSKKIDNFEVAKNIFFG